MGLLNNFISGIPSLEGNELVEVFSHYLYMYNSCLCSLCFLSLCNLLLVPFCSSSP